LCQWFLPLADALAVATALSVTLVLSQPSATVSLLRFPPRPFPAPLSGIPGCSSVAARAAAGTAARILSTDTAGSVAAAVSASASLAFRLSL